MDEYGFRRLLLPSQSSDLNPVESVWAKLKRKWSLKLLQAQGSIRLSNFEAELDSLVKAETQDCRNYRTAALDLYKRLVARATGQPEDVFQ